MVDEGIYRREFLKATAAGVALLLTSERLRAAESDDEQAVAGPPVKFGVVGLGIWGKEILSSLSRLPSAQVTAICDTYEPFLTRSKEIAPAAATFDDYRKLLESNEVEAVVIATPSHQHKEVALASIQAGKHVYCEAPLASSVDDARAIALAGKNSAKVFQAGIQGRSNALYDHVAKFVKAGCLGDPAQVFAQGHRRDSMRRMAPTPEREKELNWRLVRDTSPGLVGEWGIHSLDLANWYLGVLPTSVIGYGSVNAWKDGRDVPDTVQCIVEYPKNVRLIYASTLASSFSSFYTLFQGTGSSLLMREDRGWMIKEADSPLLGWEVYAKKEQCFDETGICMLADATKILQAGGNEGEDHPVEPPKEALYLALENFTRSIRENAKPTCGALEGYQATVTALKANEAITSGSKVTYEPSLFEL